MNSWIFHTFIIVIKYFVSFNCNGNSKKYTARHADMGEAVKDGVEREEQAARAAQGHGDEEEAAGQEGDVGKTEAGEQRREDSLSFPDVHRI